VKTNGTLWCWGGDGSGQLGNGAGGSTTSPAQESTSATDWALVSAGQGHTCAVKTNGTLWCWGNDGSGKLGNGAVTGNQQSPYQESTAAADWASVAAGGSHTCAVKTNGALWCWGNDGSGQLGNVGITGDQVSPSQASTAATNWASVSTGSNHTCAIRMDGTLWCWGLNDNGQTGTGVPYFPVSPLKNIECMNPALAEGTIIYNSSLNLMQYCDSVSWVRIGK
jgi:alpha-tubulin suppressor-like RCC1 family protein